MGPDGGVVVATSTGDVYSLTADGALRWHVPSVATDGGPSVGSDGSVYVAAMHKVTAIAPDGSIRWTFTEPAASGQGVIAGPSVGPDGNIYAISDLGGLGAFALFPSGQPLWSNPGSPAFAETGNSASRSCSAPGGSSRLRRGRHRAERHVRTGTERRPAVGQATRRHRRPVHAATASAGHRTGRQPLPDRHGRRERVEPVSNRPGHRQRALVTLAGTLQRDVRAPRRATRLGLLRA